MGVPYQNVDMTSHLQYLTVRNERGQELLDSGGCAGSCFLALRLLDAVALGPGWHCPGLLLNFLCHAAAPCSEGAAGGGAADERRQQGTLCDADSAGRRRVSSLLRVPAVPLQYCRSSCPVWDLLAACSACCCCGASAGQTLLSQEPATLPLNPPCAVAQSHVVPRACLPLPACPPACLPACRGKLGKAPDPAPRWLGNLLAWVLGKVGPQGLEFAKYSIDYHYIR